MEVWWETEKQDGGVSGQKMCVHVGSRAKFSRSRHAALPVSGRLQSLGPVTQDATQVQSPVSGRGSEETCDVYFLLTSAEQSNNS